MNTYITFYIMIKSLYFCVVVATGNSWDLKYFGIDENYYTSSIAIYRTRAFLVLPRDVCNNNVSYPTVVEVPWTGKYKQSVIGIKNIRPKLHDLQKWGDCTNIQNAVSSDIELKKPKLWILDKGNEFCHPKILSFNIIFNLISEVSELKDIPRRDLNVISIDPQSADVGYMMYIGNAGDNTLLVFSLQNLKWWKVVLREINNTPVPIKVDFLAISKVDSVLYVTGKNNLDLFSINLEHLRRPVESASDESGEENDSSIEVNITLIGQKLGVSSGLETDYKEGLNYYMVRDYAVVRWLIGSPMDAEHHNVLAQSYDKLPYVAQLFSDSQNGLWALVNPLSVDECNVLNSTIRKSIPKLESRVLKVVKYKLLDDIY